MEHTTLEQNVQHTPPQQTRWETANGALISRSRHGCFLNYHSYTIPLPRSSSCYFGDDERPTNLRTSPPKSSPNLRGSPPCTVASNRDLDKSGRKRDIQPDSEIRHSCPAAKPLGAHVHSRPTLTILPPPPPPAWNPYSLDIIETFCRC